MHLGYDCHIQLVKFLLLNPKLGDQASEALPTSVQIWKTCALVVDVDQSDLCNSNGNNRRVRVPSATFNLIIYDDTRRMKE